MAKKIAASVAKAIREEIAIRCRVQRPNVVDFMLSGEFSKLPAVKSSIIDSPWERYKAQKAGTLVGWDIPEEDLGRKGTKNTAESIRLWIKQNLGEYFPSDTVAVLQDDEGKVTIYRKG